MALAKSLGGGGGAVSSVFGRTGAVVKVSGDYAVADVTGAAPLASPALTGTPTAPTAGAGTNTTQIATTAFVAAAVAAGGGGAAEVLITETVVGVGGVASVTFSSIASTYRDLRVVVRGRGTTAATEVDVYMRLNGDTGSNYDYAGQQNVGTTQTPFDNNNSFAYVGLITAGSSPSDAAGVVEIRLYDYRGTVFQKEYQSWAAWRRANTANNRGRITLGGDWRSTAAVTSVQVYPSAGNFAQDSVVSLYGIL